MPQKFDVHKKDVLLSEEREARVQPAKLLRSLGLEPGNHLADIGCGPGFFTLPAAAIVGPTGLVFAADIQGDMLSTVRARAAERGLTNIRVVKTSESEVPIPPGTCDVVLLAFTLHELEHHASFLHRLARLLTPSGKLAVVEWHKLDQPEGPPVQDRIAPDDLIADAHAAGLALERQQEIGAHEYLCVFTRVAS